MNFITQGKTNWKYIFIVIILTSIVSGWALLYQHLWALEKESMATRKEMGTETSIIFDGRTINQGEEFIIILSEHCAGDIKLRLIEVLADSVIIDILEDRRFDGNFHPRNEVERKEIKTNSCIGVFPFCLDVWSTCCFDIEKSGSQIMLKYRVESESTMPLPND